MTPEEHFKAQLLKLEEQLGRLTEENYELSQRLATVEMTLFGAEENPTQERCRRRLVELLPFERRDGLLTRFQRHIQDHHGVKHS